MNDDLSPITAPGLKPVTSSLPVLWCETEEVAGHIEGDVGLLLKCWSCTQGFRVRPPLRNDVLYVCSHCLTLNQAEAGDSQGSRITTVSQRPANPRQTIPLDSFFFQDPKGVPYEIPTEVLRRYRVGAARLQELGHAPFPPMDENEVMGHHKVPGASAADASGWSYHTSWEYGCYFDEAAGHFAVGMHRHPYGDERAVPSLESDFS